jgi:hypothetical protein
MAEDHEMRDPRRGYLPLLKELQQLYPSLVGKYPAWRSGYRNVAHLAHGWYLRCHRGVEAIVFLGDEGYAEEASPIRRSVIDHVLALQWLSIEGDKILDTVARGHAQNTRKRGEAVSAAEWTSVDLAQFGKTIENINPDSRDPHNDRMLHFGQRVAKYGDEHTMPGYQAENARTYPSYESAVCYVEHQTGALLWQSQDSLWQVPFATMHLLEALLALRHVFDPDPWEAELGGIVERFLATTDEVRRQDGLPPVDWSTGTVAVHHDVEG